MEGRRSGKSDQQKFSVRFSLPRLGCLLCGERAEDVSRIEREKLFSTDHPVPTLRSIENHPWVRFSISRETCFAGLKSHQAPIPGHLVPPSTEQLPTHYISGRRTRAAMEQGHGTAELLELLSPPA